ncbi:hypothetical protein B5F77_09520 [Parabacteroides sp. An277]|uniref:lipopolysaccharide biosynthesis protein n=1 Tax=Parabacteroides sp. An277 TaxID=1965619 RepID=UPI000B371E93|nr:oligosaccharide flippase family protein [Parabacteroides sp. An277]OUO51794.1 hypothetical protein B5F77_09520 [Parabacteroides sp. An277]
MQEDNNKRIAKNTLLLYVRMLCTMVVSLYTSRIILQTLGVEDFGIYNVVGGIVAMFSLFSGSLSSSISRFLTFELGKGNISQLQKVFSTAINIQVAISLLILILSEIIGVWFLNHKMVIPAERLTAANWVLQCSILTFIVNLISIPYNALIIAHERMQFFAYISILEVVLKLSVVFLLMYIDSYDKLVIYGILLLLVALIVRLTYTVYSKHHFEESTYQQIFDKSLWKEMMKFAGWNTIGVASAVFKDQGVNIVLNLFCGPAVNAARAISVQVNTAIGAFIANFMTALNPQITKSYAIGDFSYMRTLVQQGARFSFYLLLFLSIPVLIETETILSLWLHTVPDYTIHFVRLILILALCESLSGTLITAMLATGRIRNYQIIVGGLQMMNFPLSYIALRMGGKPEVTMIIAIVISIVNLFVRIFFLKKMIGLSTEYYLTKVVGNICLVSAGSLICPMLAFYGLESSIWRFLLVCIISVPSTLLIIYFIGCSTVERAWIHAQINLVKQRFK